MLRCVYSGVSVAVDYVYDYCIKKEKERKIVAEKR